MNVFPVERRDEGLIEFHQQAVGQVVAVVLNLLDSLDLARHALVIVVVQQLSQNSGRIDNIAGHFLEHVEKLGFTRDQAHARLQPAAVVGRSMEDAIRAR